MRPLLFVMIFFGVTTAQVEPNSVLPQTAASTLEKWLQESQVSQQLQLEKLRRVSASSTETDDPESKSLHLDLRFVTQENEESQAAAAFADLLNKYQQANGVSLPETVFYKLIHECDWPRGDAIVDFIVLEDHFAVFLDQKTRVLVFRQTNRRDPVRQVVTLPLIASTKTSGPNQVIVKTTNPSDANALAQKIQGFFERYFMDTNKRAHMNDPAFNYEPIEADYVGLKVSGVKKQMLPANNYWERITVSVEIKPGPEGKKLDCFISGKYASGWGSRLPSADDYHEIDESQVRVFTGTILRKLQDYIAAGAQ